MKTTKSATIGEQLRLIRIRSGLTQEGLAAKVGVTQQSIAKWERGTVTPRGRQINSIMEVIGPLDDDEHSVALPSPLPVPAPLHELLLAEVIINTLQNVLSDEQRLLVAAQLAAAGPQGNTPHPFRRAPCRDHCRGRKLFATTPGITAYDQHQQQTKTQQRSNLMSARDPIPFRFEKHDIRVVHIDGEPHFAGKDVCDALGYVDATTAIRSHCKGVQKLHPLLTGGGMQSSRVLAESDVLRLIVSSTLPAAAAFERWLFEEVLPSIRKTGTYSIPGAPSKPRSRAAQSLLSDARAIDFIGNMIAKVPGARADVVAAIKLRLIEERTGLPATQFGGALPAESLAIAVKLNPTEIGKRLTPKLSPIRVNKILIDLGLQRKSESGYVLTEAGAAHGESRPFQAENHHIGDQINWYKSIVDVMREAIKRPPPGAQGKLGID